MENSQMILEQDENNLRLELVQNEVDKIKIQIEEGSVNPLDVYLKAKYLNDITGSLMKQIKSPVFDEIDNYPKEDRIKYGAKFNRRSGYELLNYDDDSEYKELESKLKARKELLKEARKMQKKNVIFVTEDGETIEAPSVSKIVEDSITINFKK